MYISDKLSHHICDKLLEQEIIQTNAYPYYQYSFDYVLDLILFHCSLLIIGFFLHAPFLSLLYILTLTPLKMFSGGAHADTRISCSVISYTIFLTGILITKYHLFSLYPNISIFIFVTISFTIFLLSPVECENKKISPNRKRTYKKRCGSVLCIQFFAFLYFIKKNHTDCFSLMTFCVIIILINQIIGMIINSTHRKGEKNASFKHRYLR